MVVLSVMSRPASMSRQPDGNMISMAHLVNMKSMQALCTLKTLKHMQQSKDMR